MIDDILPEYLYNPQKKEEAIQYIASLKIFPKYKKYALLEWSKITGVTLTQEDYILLGINPRLA